MRTLRVIILSEKEMKLQTPLFFLVPFIVTVGVVFASDYRTKRDVQSDFPGFDWLQSFTPLGRGFSFTIQIPDFQAYSTQLLRSIQGVLQNIQSTLESEVRSYPDGTTSDVFFVDGMRCNVKRSVRRSREGEAFAFASGYSCVPT
ncbi:uncharacterized protein LOC111087090 isoform X2 [Limulus polyphemus]|uniref:Uncharacterized protein LOC111087090 isoform X2 n=1 Tax=Limulus polyphemus TaxID=6850 RepID=A0ABM1SX24_LIMPO|nr:uncharacterized protein LOC111087090 isoform X2 [Limulus polyphemus]